MLKVIGAYFDNLLFLLNRKVFLTLYKEYIKKMRVNLIAYNERILKIFVN